MFRTSLILFFFIASLSSVVGQYVITGAITNDYGEDLEGAVVYIENTEELATVTDYAGRYLIENVPAGTYVLSVTFLGYEKYSVDISVAEDMLIDISLDNASFQLEKVEVLANKLTDIAPFSYTEKNKEEINLKNLGQDVPFLLEHTPSMVVTSDAGAGIGYTGMRLRGSDATRVNITINGVPLNDSESHGVFWVNLPDFSSSVDKVQIQRGVGPSTNGAAAFGGSVAFNTNYINQNPYFKADLSYGSFNTRKIGLSLSTGLMNGKFLIEGRYSKLDSEGYIDRARSDLESWYFSVANIGEKHTLKFNLFSGSERTFQAWNGVPYEKLFGTQEELQDHFVRNSNGQYNSVEDSLNLFNSGRNYNAYLYSGQVDDYGQDHYQLLYGLQAADNVKINLTGHYTKGRGFFEEFLYQNDACWYLDCAQIEDSTTVDDLVRRRWLDNHFFGLIANTEISLSDELRLTIGGSGNAYLGDHFGEIINALNDDELRSDIFSLGNAEYYRSDASKIEFNAYAKADYALSDKLNIFGDIQLRNIAYETEGTDNDPFFITRNVAVDTSYTFVNPKFGLSYLLDQKNLVYLSYAKGAREPVRSDFLDGAGVIPKHEQLNDFELGYRGKKKFLGDENFSLEANLYVMLYQDQLVLTGAVNQDGASIRTNVDKSSRIGLELAATYNFNDYFSWSPNLTLSRNKIAEFLDETFTNELVQNTDISFSPNIIAGSTLSYNIVQGLDVTLLTKYVGKQFLDITSDDSRSISAYVVNDLLLSYEIETDLLERIQFRFLVNNLLNTEFSSNGYTYSYQGGNGLITERYFYPQAGINFLLSGSFIF